jgi:hypothetical protein
MPTYVIKHVLPDESTVGYHADTFCTVVPTLELAKPMLTDDVSIANVWLRVVRKNFEYIWGMEASEFGGESKYSEDKIWKGHLLEEITTVLVEI